jgi:hypothetical protein
MRAALILGTLALGATLASADSLYTTGTFDPELAFASDSVPGQFNNQRLAEAFVLPSMSNLSDVNWWGRSEGSFFHDLTNMSNFTIAIFADAGAIPGTQVFSATVPVASVTPTVVGTDSSGNDIYNFDFGFGSGLTLDRGTYWLSVGTENVDPNGDGFYWQASQERISGNFAADNGVSGSWGTSGFADLALQVNGAPVPEPASIAAIGLGIAGLLRRRSKRS